MGIEVIARAVILHEDKLLLAHSRGARNTYLPGGHVEFGEGARAALARELDEELGVTAQVGSFLGAVEHRFAAGARDHHEVNLIFILTNPTAFLGVSSREEQLEVFWQPVDALEKVNLQPGPVSQLVRRWLSGQGREEGWGSTMEG